MTRPASSATAALAAALLASCASAPADEGTRVPAERVGRYWLVECALDGRAPYTFLLDTGSGPTLVDDEVAAAHPELERRPGSTITSASGSDLRTQSSIRFGDVSLGGVSLGSLETRVVDLDEFSLAIGRRLDGLLGLDAFLGRTLVIDGVAGTVSLGGESLVHRRDLDVLRLVPRGSRWVLEARVGRRRVDVELDSGFDGALLLPRDVDLPFAVGPLEGAPALTIDGEPRPLAVGRLADDLLLGPHRLPRPIARLGPGDHALLGARYLRHFRTTYDLLHGLVALEYVSGESLEAPPWFDMGIAFEVASRGWLVTGTHPDSDARAQGLLPGDRIVTLDGVDFDDYAGLWPSHALREGGAVRLGVERGNDRFPLTVRSFPLVP